MACRPLEQKKGVCVCVKTNEEHSEISAHFLNITFGLHHTNPNPTPPPSHLSLTLIQPSLISYLL